MFVLSLYHFMSLPCFIDQLTPLPRGRCLPLKNCVHRIIWHASSRGVASNNMELENTKGIPGEPDKKLKESKEKQQNARKIQSYSA